MRGTDFVYAISAPVRSEIGTLRMKQNSFEVRCVFVSCTYVFESIPNVELL